MTFEILLATLFTAFQKDLDEPTAVLYERGLDDVPLPLLSAAMTKAIKTRVFLPAIAELRKDAETCRAEYLKAHPYARCDACRDACGFVPVIEAGVERMAKCGCFAAYRAGLEALGITERPVLQLTEAEA